MIAGNLVRNGDELCADLLKLDVMQSLLQVVLKENASPRRIALYSIGNMCNHAECKQLAKELGLKGILDDSLARITSDETEQKYVVRILQKIN